MIASLPTSRPSRGRHRFYRKRKCTVRGIETGATMCGGGDPLTGDQRCEPGAHGRRTGRATYGCILACTCHGSHGTHHAIGYESEKHAQKKKTALLTLLLLKLTMRANYCANAKARKPRTGRTCVVWTDTLSCHLRQHVRYKYMHMLRA